MDAFTWDKRIDFIGMQLRTRRKIAFADCLAIKGRPDPSSMTDKW